MSPMAISREHVSSFAGRLSAAVARLVLLPVLLLCLAASGAAAQKDAPTDGTLVEQTPCPPDTTTYEQYVEAAKSFYSREVEAAAQEGFRIKAPADPAKGLLSKEDFERQRAYEGFECRRIQYLSDDLKVVGFLWKPKGTEGKKLPLIIYNRGGNREFGKLTPWTQRGFYSFVSNGFVVIASQYRGNDGGEGREEFGGADVRDVLNLIPLARSLGYADMNNVFLLGWSRGGMMTALALKSGIPVNAAAIGGGPGDLVATTQDRPAFIEMWKEMMPGFDTRRDELLRERSAIYWADRINVPLLLMHGGADWRVDPGETLALAQKLQALGKTYELIVYANDDHRLSANRADSTQRTIEWFRRHMK